MLTVNWQPLKDAPLNMLMGSISSGAALDSDLTSFFSATCVSFLQNKESYKNSSLRHLLMSCLNKKHSLLGFRTNHYTLDDFAPENDMSHRRVNPLYASSSCEISPKFQPQNIISFYFGVGLCSRVLSRFLDHLPHQTLV